MKRNPFILVALSVISTLVLSGLALTTLDSQATSTAKSICVNKETKVLKLRNKCKANERYTGSADVLKNGGESAYEIWLGLGNQGSERDFINSLRGPSGSSGAGSPRNPFEGMTCIGASAFSEQYLHRSRVFKANWDYIERVTGCDLDTTQIVEYVNFPEFNGVLSSYELRVTGPAVPTTASRGFGRYEVPIVVEYELDLSNGWIVCDSSLPVYGNTSWSTADRFAYWDALEQDKVSGSSYISEMTAVINPFGIYIYKGNGDDEFYIPVCKESPTNSFGWVSQTIYPLPIYNPGDFLGLEIPYISEWGWE